jgi:YkoY family integral membrane protein
MDFHATDLLTIALLVILEGLLSADNALVLAILVLGLPKKDQKKALKYGILGAFFFRIVAILLAVHLIQVGFVKLIGAAYLLWLSYSHFFGKRAEGETRQAIKPATGFWGLSAFWATVVKVELTDIVFAVDSILVAVAMSPKTWVIITGGILGIIAMRMVIGQLLRVVRRYPALVDAAFVIIAWVAIKLLIEYLNTAGYTTIHINKWLSFGFIAVIFGAAYLYARSKGPVEDDEEEERATKLLERHERDKAKD